MLPRAHSALLAAAFVAAASPLQAGDISDRLTLSDARQIVANFATPGTVFRVRDGRYAIADVRVRERNQTFVVEIDIRALEKAP